MNQPRQTPGRIMGLDYGTARVGVAVSDGLGITAQPVVVLPRQDPRLMERLTALVEEYEVTRVVVGLPTSLDGTERQAAQSARRFAAQVAEALQVEVVFHDERFTTKIAERVLIDAGTSRAKRRGRVDKMAAAIMLQGFLDGAQPRGQK